MPDRSFPRTALLWLLLLAGCFQTAPPASDATAGNGLANRVCKALAGHEEQALLYAGCYEVLAGRFEARAYATTTDAARVAGRAAEILELPGLLKDVVNEELNPLLGKPQPITPELATRATLKLRELAAACREVAP